MSNQLMENIKKKLKKLNRKLWKVTRFVALPFNMLFSLVDRTIGLVKILAKKIKNYGEEKEEREIKAEVKKKYRAHVIQAKKDSVVDFFNRLLAEISYAFDNVKNFVSEKFGAVKAKSQETIEAAKAKGQEAVEAVKGFQEETTEKIKSIKLKKQKPAPKKDESEQVKKFLSKQAQKEAAEKEEKLEAYEEAKAERQKLEVQRSIIEAQMEGAKEAAEIVDNLEKARIDFEKAAKAVKEELEKTPKRSNGKKKN